MFKTRVLGGTPKKKTKSVNNFVGVWGYPNKEFS